MYISPNTKQTRPHTVTGTRLQPPKQQSKPQNHTPTQTVICISIPLCLGIPPVTRWGSTTGSGQAVTVSVTTLRGRSTTNQPPPTLSGQTTTGIQGITSRDRSVPPISGLDSPGLELCGLTCVALSYILVSVRMVRS